MSKSILVPACILAALAASTSSAAGPQRTFTTPQDAVLALVEAVKAGNLDDVQTIFGVEGADLIASSDPATGRRHREVFSVAAAERWLLVDDGATRKTLVIGNEEWPFPVPLVNDGGRWRFDTAAGREEILARRIGRNELATIDTCRAYVAAQQRYVAQGHDGKPAGAYASSFRSDPGKENGLYWPAAHGQKRSPLGDLVAQAAEEGRPIGTAGASPAPFHGYYFRILTGQAPVAPVGFALVAWPAQRDATGVMTFVAGQDGVVFEKDLGPDTDATVRKMTAFRLDASWHKVAPASDRPAAPR